MTNPIDKQLKNAQQQRAKLASLQRQVERQKTVVQEAQAELARSLSSKQAEAAPVAVTAEAQ
jgi:hypothetical protein